MFGKRTKSKNNLNISKESLAVSHDSLVSTESPGGSYREASSLNTSGLHSLHSRRAGFSAHYLGAVSRFMMLPGNRKSMESQLVAKIEEEQLDGKLKLKPSVAEAVRLRLDRHGFQITREDCDDIILRVPLHTLAQLVMYDDGFGKNNLAIKVIVGKDLFSCHVFQCANEDTAMSICDTLQRVFRAIMAESDTSM